MSEVIKVDSCVPLQGRLIVKTKKSDEYNPEFGMDTGVDPHDTVFAEVIRTSDEDTFPVGSTVMYDRIHGKSFHAEGVDGNVTTFKVVMVSDISFVVK